MTNKLIWAAVFFILCQLMPGSVHAFEACRVLVLAFDTSGSLYTEKAVLAEGSEPVPHWIVQRDGHIAALQDSEVQALLFAKETYLGATIWSQEGLGRVIVPPALMASPEDVNAFTTMLMLMIPSGVDKSPATAHNRAITEALDALTLVPRNCATLIIDISTDQGYRRE